MRALSLLLLFAGALNLVACGDDKPTDSDTPEGDTDTDSDTDSDTDTDLTEPGGDIASAWDLEFDTEGFVETSDLINPAGDRDFYHIEPSVGLAVAVYTQVYAINESTQPDTVLRIYDSAGTMITENDDQPYRWNETDSFGSAVAAAIGLWQITHSWVFWREPPWSPRATWHWLQRAMSTDARRATTGDASRE